MIDRFGKESRTARRMLCDLRVSAVIIAVLTLVGQSWPASAQENRELLAPPPVRLLEPRPITLAEAEESAVHNNPAVAEAAARVEALRGKWLQVGMKPNPSVGYSGQQLGSGGLAEQHGVFLGQEFVRGKKLAINRHIVDHEIDQAEQVWSTARTRAATDARIRYYSALVSQQRLTLTGELLRLAQDVLAVTQARLQANEAIRSEVLQARIESQQAAILHRQTQLELEATRRRLHAVMGRPAVADRPLEGGVDEALPDLAWQPTLARLLAESPEISAAVSGIDIAEVALQRAQVEAVPNVEIQAILQDDRGTRQMNGAVQATLPLPLWNRNQGGIQQARSELIAAERVVLRRELELQDRLADVFRRYRSARNQVDTFRQHLLPDAQENLNLVREGYQAGEFDYLQLLTAQRTFINASLTHLAAVEEARITLAEIDGLLLRDSLADR